MKSSTRTIQIEVDELTAHRLDNLAAACESRRESVAASLLHDVLRDDELFNDCEPFASGTLH